MKMRRRILSIAVCLILTLNLFTPAFATTSQTFFREAHYGYLCTGTGSYSEGECIVSLTASEINNTPHIPPDECHSEVWLYAYDSAGKYVGINYDNGSTSASAQCKASGTIARIEYAFKFTGHDLGTYTINV